MTKTDSKKKKVKSDTVIVSVKIRQDQKDIFTDNPTINFSAVVREALDEYIQDRRLQRK